MTLLNEPPAAPVLADADVRTDQPTRTAKLKWVVVVDRDLPAGIAMNAVACVAASVGRAVPNVVGPGGLDASGGHHRGLAWLGCTVLAGDAGELRRLRARAADKDGLLVVDMTTQAQATRVYDDYLSALAGTGADDIAYHAVSVVGPRNKVDKLTGRLPLLR